MSQTFYWYDFETFGANPQKDRPCQFAGVRTDEQFRPLGEPLVIYCKPSDDVLPHPEACLITGITPQDALKEGLPETEFAARIHQEFSVPNTCVVGYNNIRFDDEVTRYLFYRNFLDPYAREWQQGNSRWDLIDVVRMAYALRPEGIQWPTQADGERPSFKLELLTEANGISHESAHDALSDVYATIAVARLIRDRQPKLFEYALNLRHKQAVRAQIDVARMKPFVHVSSKYPSEWGCCALVAPLIQHPTNQNGVVVYDLRHDPSDLITLDEEAIKQRLYTPVAELPEGQARIPLKTLHVNKCPALAPASLLKQMPAERLAQLQLHSDQLKAHLTQLREAPGLREKLTRLLNEPYQDAPIDPDFMLYSGGFFSDQDRARMAELRASSPATLQQGQWAFDDPRLPEMLFRYRARNFPQSLSEDEHERWEQWRFSYLSDERLASITFKAFAERVNALGQSHELEAKQHHILQDLVLYAESIYPAG